MIANIDLHLHSKYSMGTSKFMSIENIVKYGKLKGLDIIGTGDCLNPKWLDEIKNHLNDNLVLTTEVEDKFRVHHLIILPNLGQTAELIDYFSKYSKNISYEGRPNVSLDGKQIMDIVKDLGGLIGPAHVFTPWTSLYKTYDSVYDCYGKKPDYIELGLSADTDMADMVEELRDIPFLSNSDAHSFYPHRMGREFNQMEISSVGDVEHNFEEIKNAIKNNKIVANYGLDPNLGKYHTTACTRCYLRYDIDDAIKFKFKCKECGGTIKKGVLERSGELSKDNKVIHPSFRPPYHKIIPLAEIISFSIDKGINTKSVQTLYDKYLGNFKNEIEILTKSDIHELKAIHETVGQTIEKFRNNTINIYPGGGGEYGYISKNPVKIKRYEQKTTLENWMG
ncbi:TIGR00375 family protein [Methanococcus voltae]|uniref:Uncharacterized protein (TIGR00375 family) n=1 Tax=Methanococcus voltae PS TaxID=523842 RepID=A0ABT2EXH1_METVO|nr:TIGR00375 family protein [Methanococcus voltae]MBP2172750.1 uncharacterized protein (TIGR00375 family) [Methanococcus voltae]MCS3922664.1 uncharacterized protein (TIGR00375 family) [Methanococcus voltae PS]